MYSGLGDLDELVLKCRDERAREFIAEAVASYKVGAYRSAIIATWIAVNFDIVVKLRSLKLEGNVAATEWVTKYDRIRNNYDPERYKSAKPALEFERELIERIAKPDIELLSPVELYDLKRLRQDRHRCAHPTMQNAEQRFNPTAELARYHLRNAIEYVLMRPAIQGTLAINRVLSLIRDEGFPMDNGDAKRLLQESDLAGISASNIRSVLGPLLDDLLDSATDVATRRKRLAALGGLRSVWFEDFEEAYKEHIDSVASVSGFDFWTFISGLAKQASWTWERLPLQTKSRAKQALLELDVNDPSQIPMVTDALQLPDLREAGLQKLREYPSLAVFSGVIDMPDIDLLNEGIRRLGESNSWNQSNDIIATVLRPSLLQLSPVEVKQIVDAYRTNPEVSGSFASLPFLFAILTERPDLFDTTAECWRQAIPTIERAGYAMKDDVLSLVRERLGQGVDAEMSES